MSPTQQKGPTPEQLAEHNIHVFLEVYGIKNEAGEKLDFKRHSFLWDIYEDMAPVQVIRKAAQVGFTTLAILKSLWLAKNKGLQIIYTMPTAHDINEIVGSKTNRLISNNPVFQEWVKDKDSVAQKRVGDGMIYSRGTFTERAALSISADLLVIDEFDRSDFKVVEQYDSRLQHSKYGWKWYFSNPSSPNQGTDKYWHLSDQKHWFVKCPACNKEQYLTMANVLGDGPLAYFGCSKCANPIDRTKGRWVKRFRDRAISGYWISLLMADWVTAEHILNEQRTKSADFFDNFVLGQPHVGTGNLVSRDMLFRNLVSGTNPQTGQVVIGVDTGIDHCYVVGNEMGLFYYGKCNTFEELEMLLRRWPKAIMVIDAGGDFNVARKLRDKYPHQVFLCFFRRDRKTQSIISWGKKEEYGSVTADRNKLIQLVVDEFTDKRIPIWGREEEWEAYWEHWSHIYRTVEEDKATQGERHVWMRSDRDDFVLATCYARIGMDRFNQGGGAIIAGNQERVGTFGMEVGKDGKGFVPILPSQYRQQM